MSGLKHIRDFETPFDGVIFKVFLNETTETLILKNYLNDVYQHDISTYSFEFYKDKPESLNTKIREDIAKTFAYLKE